MVLDRSPVFEYWLMYSALPVFATIVVHVVPPSVDLSIWYPVIAEPPLFTGFHQERLICDGDAVVAERYLGWSGTVAGLVVAEAILDGKLVPIALIVDTLYV